MKIIYKTCLVTYRDSHQFTVELAGGIEELQKDGCEVEIQYVPTTDFYSALLIGYKERK